MFTKEQIEEIAKKLSLLSIKDSEFSESTTFTEEDYIAIVQNEGGIQKNKKIKLKNISQDYSTLIKEINSLKTQLSELEKEMVKSTGIRYIEYVNSTPADPKEDTLYIIKECD